MQLLVTECPILTYQFFSTVPAQLPSLQKNNRNWFCLRWLSICEEVRLQQIIRFYFFLDSIVTSFLTMLTYCLAIAVRPCFYRLPITLWSCDPFFFKRTIITTIDSSLTKNYFLTHFHSDHYGGITSSWDAGIIYCSLPTAKLVHQQLGVDMKYLHPDEFLGIINQRNTIIKDNLGVESNSYDDDVVEVVERSSRSSKRWWWRKQSYE